MRTTLDIADDVLQAVKERARREKTTAGAVLSELARRALTTGLGTQTSRPSKSAHGFRPFARRGAVVSNEVVDRLREDDAY